MNVTISVGGKFQAFDLARELEKRGGLSRLITSYPRSFLDPYEVPRSKVRSVLLKEGIERAWKLLPFRLRTCLNPQNLACETYDRIAEQLLPGEIDIFVGFSSFSLHSLREAKKRGAKIVIERASSHIAYQDKLLREEYNRLGTTIFPWQLSHPKNIEKELLEYEEADFISVPSTFVKNTFLEYGFPPEKIVAIPYGVDVRMFSPTVKRDSVFLLIFGGGLVIRKGVHYLLQAFAELNLPKAELLLIGPVTEEIRPFLKKYAGSFRQINYQPLSELYNFYSQGSVFVFPSLEEGHGLVISQAMACGLPVIVSTNTIAHDLVREGADGFVIPVRDVDALKEKILFFYNHPEKRDEMGESALQRMRRSFTWDEYGDTMMRAYKMICQSAR